MATEKHIHEGDFGFPILIPLKTALDLSTYSIVVRCIINTTTINFPGTLLTSRGMTYVSFSFTEERPAALGTYRIYVIFTRFEEQRTIGPIQLEVDKIN